jgi:hypothetical protein
LGSQVFHIDADGVEVAVLTLQAEQHAQYQATTLHAWRVRTFAGALVTEVAGVELPADGSGLVSVHITLCA